MINPADDTLCAARLGAEAMQSACACSQRDASHTSCSPEAAQSPEPGHVCLLVIFLLPLQE